MAADIQTANIGHGHLISKDLAKISKDLVTFSKDLVTFSKDLAKISNVFTDTALPSST
jgi:hypothetical protein